MNLLDGKHHAELLAYQLVDQDVAGVAIDADVIISEIIGIMNLIVIEGQTGSFNFQQ